MGTTVNNNTKVNISPYNILVNGHLANPQIEGPYIDIVKISLIMLNYLSQLIGLT